MSLCFLLARVTREHRENLATLAKQFTNKAKESLRKVRAGAINQTKKAKSTVSEDTLRLIEKQVCFYSWAGFFLCSKRIHLAWQHTRQPTPNGSS